MESESRPKNFVSFVGVTENTSYCSLPFEAVVPVRLLEQPRLQRPVVAREVLRLVTHYHTQRGLPLATAYQLVVAASGLKLATVERRHLAALRQAVVCLPQHCSAKDY